MSFAKDVAAISKAMQVDLETTANEIFKELFSSVVKDTPVDTGRLQGNWQASEGAPIVREIERTHESGPLAEIQQVIRKPALYYLTNNLPYAARIEFDGWSHTKAPAGMVRKNVARIRSIVRQRANAYRTRTS